MIDSGPRGDKADAPSGGPARPGAGPTVLDIGRKGQQYRGRMRNSAPSPGVQALRRFAHRVKVGIGRLPDRLRPPRPLPALDDLDVHYNEVLDSDREIEDAVTALDWQHPHHRGKTWDVFKALHYVLRAAPDRERRVLDAGCSNSPILERLHAYGYRSLFGCDLTDADIPRVPGLTFWRGSLTDTAFPAGEFDVVTCLSVIEHGVSLDDFFTEMARLLAPSGHLLVSTDYREPKLSAAEVPRSTTFGQPWTIFSRREIDDLVTAAARHDFRLVEPIRWGTGGAPIRWAGRQYTFIFLAFRKTPPRH
jgi:SAM-dependent methyltransferase